MSETNDSAPNLRNGEEMPRRSEIRLWDELEGIRSELNSYSHVYDEVQEKFKLIQQITGELVTAVTTTSDKMNWLRDEREKLFNETERLRNKVRAAEDFESANVKNGTRNSNANQNNVPNNDQYKIYEEEFPKLSNISKRLRLKILSKKATESSRVYSLNSHQKASSRTVSGRRTRQCQKQRSNVYDIDLKKPTPTYTISQIIRQPAKIAKRISETAKFQKRDTNLEQEDSCKNHVLPAVVQPTQGEKPLVQPPSDELSPEEPNDEGENELPFLNLQAQKGNTEKHKEASVTGITKLKNNDLLDNDQREECEKEKEKKENIGPKEENISIPPKEETEVDVEDCSKANSTDDSTASSNEKISRSFSGQHTSRLASEETSSPEFIDSKSSEETSDMQLHSTDASVIVDNNHIDNADKPHFEQNSLGPVAKEITQSTGTGTSADDISGTVRADSDEKSTVSHIASDSVEPLDSETGESGTSKASEPQDLSKTQQRRNEQAENRRNRMMEKQRKQNKMRQDIEAKQAAKKAAEEVVQATTEAVDSYQKREDNRAKKKAEKEAKEARKAAAEKEEAEFERLVKIYNRTTSWGDMSGEIRNIPLGFNENYVENFLMNRVSEHRREENEDLAMKCSVLLRNICPLILNDFFPVFLRKASYEESLKVERNLYVAIKSEEYSYEASMCILSGDRETAQMYVENFVSNYIAIQEAIRYRNQAFPPGYETDTFQMAIMHEEYRRKQGVKVNQEWSAHTCRSMVSHFEESPRYNAFFYLLANEISKHLNNPLIALDFSAFPLIGSDMFSRENAYLLYIKLVTRTCTF